MYPKRKSQFSHNFTIFYKCRNSYFCHKQAKTYYSHLSNLGRIIFGSMAVRVHINIVLDIRKAQRRRHWHRNKCFQLNILLKNVNIIKQQTVTVTKKWPRSILLKQC